MVDRSFPQQMTLTHAAISEKPDLTEDDGRMDGRHKRHYRSF